MTKSLQIEAQQMSEGKEAAWDETRWKKHWQDRREGHRKRLERLHKEARGLKGSQVC